VKVREWILWVLVGLIILFLILAGFRIIEYPFVAALKVIEADIKEIKAEIKEIKAEILAPVRAVGEIKPPRLIKEVKPIYPEDARQKRVEGTVILEATTDIYGRVQRVEVLRSIPLLDQAAIDAVRQWIYEPEIIEGKPRGIIFTITVTFKLKEPQ
jgi:TonB family protein